MCFVNNICKISNFFPKSLQNMPLGHTKGHNISIDNQYVTSIWGTTQGTKRACIYKVRTLIELYKYINIIIYINIGFDPKLKLWSLAVKSSKAALYYKIIL